MATAADQEHAKDISLKGVVGIQNMGNTCYSNSTIQLIRACPEWNAYCVSQDFAEQLKEKSEDDVPKRILLAYQDIIKAIWSAYRPAYVRPMGFITEIRKAVKGTVYEMFGIPMPNDSHEFLIYLLDNFHEAIKTTLPHTDQVIPIGLSPIDTMRIQAQNGWNRFIANNMSEIVRLFFGMMRKIITCSSCGFNSYQWEIFNSLKIPCEGASFDECLRNETKESEIEDYQCDNCNGRHKAKIYSHIWKLPENIFVTLRRFTFDGRKNITRGPYNGEIVNFSSIFAEESDDSSRGWNYELRGISDHHGSHMGGHYTAQFKHPISGEWWWFDDNHSQKLEHPRFTESNYIYLFRRNTTV
jgi:ubiquitin C-terminal hydrolase